MSASHEMLTTGFLSEWRCYHCMNCKVSCMCNYENNIGSECMTVKERQEPHMYIYVYDIQ